MGRVRAFENAIFGLVAQDVQQFAGLDYLPEFRQEHGDTGKLFGVAGKFPCQHSEYLVNNGFRDGEIEATFHSGQHGIFCLYAR